MCTIWRAWPKWPNARITHIHRAYKNTCMQTYMFVYVLQNLRHTKVLINRYKCAHEYLRFHMLSRNWCIRKCEALQRAVTTLLFPLESMNELGTQVSLLCFPLGISLCGEVTETLSLFLQVNMYMYVRSVQTSIFGGNIHILNQYICNFAYAYTHIDITCIFIHTHLIHIRTHIWYVHTHAHIHW